MVLKSFPLPNVGDCHTTLDFICNSQHKWNISQHKRAWICVRDSGITVFFYAVNGNHSNCILIYIAVHSLACVLCYSGTSAATATTSCRRPFLWMTVLKNQTMMDPCEPHNLSLLSHLHHLPSGLLIAVKHKVNTYVGVSIFTSTG